MVRYPVDAGDAVRLDMGGRFRLSALRQLVDETSEYGDDADVLIDGRTLYVFEADEDLPVDVG